MVIGTGAVVAPGDPRPNGTQIGNLRNNGALVMQPGSAAVFEVGITADAILVSGTSTLAGTAVLTFDPGPIARRSVLISSQGGDLGTFDAVQSNLPSFFSSQLLYAPDEVDLLITSNFMGIPGLNQNQRAVANLLDTQFNNGGGTLFDLLRLNSTAQVSTALTMLTGEGATASQQTTFQAMTQFLGMLLDPFIDGRGNEAAPSVSSFAAGDSRRERLRQRIAQAHRRRARRLYDFQQGAGQGLVRSALERVGIRLRRLPDHRRQRHGRLEQRDQPALRHGGGRRLPVVPTHPCRLCAPGGVTSFSVNNLGTGRSDLFQAGAFVRHTVGPAYVAAALAYGWQDVTTDRTVTIAGVDHLRAEFNANACLGGSRAATGLYRDGPAVSVSRPMPPASSPRSTSRPMLKARVRRQHLRADLRCKERHRSRSELGIRGESLSR